jgi:hypothetical protein
VIRLEFKEQNKFERELVRTAKSEIVQRGGKVVVKYGFKVLTDSKKNVRVDTGRLRASGQLHVSASRLKAVIEYPLEYASYEHDGTRFMDGSFHLLRAIESNTAGFLGELEREVNR